MGNLKDFGVGVQIFQLYECNDINLHGDIKKLIFRRNKKRNQRCNAEYSWSNRNTLWSQLTFQSLLLILQEYPLLLALIALESLVKIPYCLIYSKLVSVQILIKFFLTKTLK